MKSFEIIPHTADYSLKIEAETLEELFLAALLGMNKVIKEGYCKNVRKLPLKHTLIVESADTTSLLIDFLSEVLAYTQIDKALFCKVIFENLQKNSLKASIFGAKAKGFDEDIKAVTYHEAEIKKNAKGNLETTVIFDI